MLIATGTAAWVDADKAYPPRLHTTPTPSPDSDTLEVTSQISPSNDDVSRDEPVKRKQLTVDVQLANQVAAAAAGENPYVIPNYIFPPICVPVINGVITLAAFRDGARLFTWMNLTLITASTPFRAECVGKSAL